MRLGHGNQKNIKGQAYVTNSFYTNIVWLRCVIL